MGQMFAGVEGGTNVCWCRGWDEYLLVLRVVQIYAGVEGETNTCLC